MIQPNTEPRLGPTMAGVAGIRHLSWGVSRGGAPPGSGGGTGLHRPGGKVALR